MHAAQSWLSSSCCWVWLLTALLVRTSASPLTPHSVLSSSLYCTSLLSLLGVNGTEPKGRRLSRKILEKCQTYISSFVLPVIGLFVCEWVNELVRLINLRVCYVCFPEVFWYEHCTFLSNEVQELVVDYRLEKELWIMHMDGNIHGDWIWCSLFK